jgi:hypothetical protein
VDKQIQEAHAAINDDDPTGTRYVDMITNVMPSFFHAMPRGSMAILNGLLSYDAPLTYNEIFKNIDKSEVVVVTGEEDNVFVPGFEPGGNTWEGLEETGAVAGGESVRFTLENLPAGTYLINMSHDALTPGGDADLYVAVGREPTMDDYDERPYLSGSDESVTIRLEQPGQIHLMVYGYDEDVTTNAFVLKATAAE